MDALRKEFDVAIVGGGPAGSSLAIRLAERGVNVILVERSVFPRDKLCGEFISPECIPHFEELGVDAQIGASGAVEIDKTVFYSRSGRGIMIENRWLGENNTRALGLARAAMDDHLLARAKRLGVVVHEGTSAIRCLAHEGNGRVYGISVRKKDGSEMNIEAPLVVDATGRQRFVARQVAQEKVPRAGQVAFKAHVTGARTAKGVCELYIYRGGYGGCIEVENDRHNLCFIVNSSVARSLSGDPHKALREAVFCNKRAAEVLSDAAAIGDWHAVPVSQFGRADLIPAEGIITIGDAAAFIDPFTGSGILLALESSKVAADPIAELFFGKRDHSAFAWSYRRRYAEMFDRRLRICSVLRYASLYPAVAETMLAMLSLNSGLRNRVARATRLGNGN